MQALNIKPEYVNQQDELKQSWHMLLNDEPNLRIRNAADRLGVSELELLLCREGITHLNAQFGNILKDLPELGEVMILTRNDEVVHEVTAACDKFVVAGNGTMGLSVGAIDTRVFLSQWAFGFEVMEQARGKERKSLQFFGRAGQALHKIYKTDNTRAGAWLALVERYAAEQSLTPELQPAPAATVRTDPVAVDVAALHSDWSELKDVHHFHAMLKRNNVDRLTAVELMERQWVKPLQRSKSGILSPLDLLLTQAKANDCPIMVFVGNAGIVQIFTGEVNKVVRAGPWMNVLDPGFNLHANTDGITQWFVVRRPSADGVITSIEGYNQAGDIVITLFGKRKPGQIESAAWQQEVAALELELCP